MGGIPWSPKLQGYRDLIELWWMMERRRKRVQVSVSRIRRFMRKTGQMQALQYDLEQSSENLKHAHKNYKTAKQFAGIWQEEFMDTLAQALAEKKGTDVATELNLMKQVERQRRQGRNVKRMRGRLGKERVTRLYFTNKEDERILCDTQATMVNACFNENETRFSQIEDTPPMRPRTILGEPQPCSQDL